MAGIRYWRVRMKVSGWRDLSEVAWDRGEVGIWYGAWTANDWREARCVEPNNPWSLIKELPRQQQLNWKSAPDIRAALRFEAIDPSDWVVVYLPGRSEIGLAHLEPELLSDIDHPLNERDDATGAMEIFKFRKISDRKTFNLADLPDAYHLLAAQGRGNVHEFHAMHEHVRLLAELDDATALRASLKAMAFDDLIDILGASAWESVCTAFLTLEHNFVPTGLSTGFTLPVFDIIGRRVPDGIHILAQCKKTPGSIVIKSEFSSAVSSYPMPCKAFYFAFGGCQGDVPRGIDVVGRKEILAWAETERGAMYRRFLTGG